mmetsp:Transcript_39483/g.84157  ORF Transcript_39483/g.84157 Transcript_39483/m.84157 type:complete len:102 (-) Transcript_39483:894-1199(-)
MTLCMRSWASTDLRAESASCRQPTWCTDCMLIRAKLRCIQCNCRSIQECGTLSCMNQHHNGRYIRSDSCKPREAGLLDAASVLAAWQRRVRVHKRLMLHKG